jgi:hypothetical protein
LSEEHNYFTHPNLKKLDMFSSKSALGIPSGKPNINPEGLPSAAGVLVKEYS